MAKIKGLCHNYDGCDLAENKVVQEVDETNFICEECGKDLYPVDGGGSISGGGKVNKKLIGIIAGAVLGVAALGGGGYAIFSSNTDDNDTVAILPQIEEVKATAISFADSVTSLELSVNEDKTLAVVLEPADAVPEEIEWKSSDEKVATVANGKVTAVGAGSAEVTATTQATQLVAKATISVKEPEVTPEPQKETQPKKQTTTGPSAAGPKVPYGRYEGPANGMGGTIYVTKSYSLDLHKADGSCLYLEPGDEIQQTKFQNGDLRQGVYVHQGSRQFFTR